MRAYRPRRTVAVSAREISEFAERWPCSGLRGLKGVSFRYDPKGDLVGIKVKNGNLDQWDGPALSALSHNAQEYAGL